MTPYLPFLIFVAAQIVTLVIYVVTTRRDQSALADRMTKSEKHHAAHYAHADNRKIHEESMDAKLIAAHFEAIKLGQAHLAERLEWHTAEDMRVMKAMNEELGSIRKGVHDLRETLLSIRGNEKHG